MRNDFFRRILVYVILSVSIFIVLISIINNIISSHTMLSREKIYNISSLAQVTTSLDFLNESIKTMAMQLYTDPSIQYLLHATLENSPEVTRSLNKLESYRNSTSFIKSINVYNNVSDIYFRTGISSLQDTSLPLLKSNAENHRTSHGIYFEPQLLTDSTSKSQQLVYYYVFLDYSTNSKEPGSAIILCIDYQWVYNLINIMKTDVNNTILIIDKSGRIIGSNNSKDLLSDGKTKPYIARLLDSNNPSENFITSVGGSKFLISSVDSKSTGMRTISITPYKRIQASSNRISISMLYAAGVLFIIGLVYSIALSRRLYKPIGLQLKTLESEIRKKHHIEKYTFFHDLLASKVELNPALIEEKLRTFDYELNPKNNLLVILFKIDHYNDFCLRHNPSDRKLMRYGLLNIAEELCGRSFYNVPMDSGEDFVVLLVSVSPDMDVPRKTLLKIIQETQNTVEKHLEFSVSSAVSWISDSLEDFQDLITSTQIAVKYRMFTGHQSVIFYEDIEGIKSDSYNYPIEQEKKMIEALILGNYDETVKLFDGIIEYCKEYSPEIFSMAINRLLTSITIAIEDIDKRILLNIESYMMELSKKEIVNEINNLFYELFKDVSQYINKKAMIVKDNKTIEIIDNIKNVIAEKYSDKNLSLNSIAEIFGFSPVYLGRLFRNNASISIGDLINDVRIAHAKELLVGTDLSINDIADAIGFSNSGYFYTVFKKYTSVTPNHFRQVSQNNSGNL